MDLNTWYYSNESNCKVANGQSRSEYKVRLAYKVTGQSVENNTSTVLARLQVKSTSSSYGTYGFNQTTKIQGHTLSAQSFDMRNTNTWQNFGEKELVFTHNDDGSKTKTLSGSFTTTATSGYSLKSGSASVDVTFPTIKRASTPTLSSSSATMGNSVTITTNRASSNFTHTLTYYFGNTNGTIATGVGASYAWTPPTSLAANITNATSGTCTIYCDTYNGSTYLGTNKLTLTLSVPSASVPTLSVSSLEMGKSVTITTNRKADNFSHVVTYSFGSTSGTISSAVTTSVNWTTSINLANQIPNATSGTCTITCKTYNGTALVGTQTKTLTLTVPSSVAPSISSISVSAGNTVIPTSWDVYVQGKSQLKVVTSASGSYSSTIKSYKITGIDGNTYNSANFTSATLQGTGTKTITVVVTDSRGRTVTKTATYTCVAYSNPSISVATVTRCDADGTDNEEGEYVKYSFKADVAPVSNKNTYSYKLGYKKSEDYSYEYITISNSSYSLNKENVVISDVTFSVDNSYDLEFLVNDYFTNATITRQLGTGFTLLDFNETGKGMAIGKVSEKNALEINMPMEVSKIEIYEGDLNDINTIKLVYADTAAANKPISYNGYCVTYILNNDYRKQLYYTDNASYSYERYCYGGNWGAWQQSVIAGIPVSGTFNRGSWNAPTKGLLTQIGDNSSAQHSVIVGLKSDGTTRNYGIDLLDSDANPVMRLYAGTNYLGISSTGVDFSGSFLQTKPTSLYENSSGSNGTITLSESAIDYVFFDIFYRDNNINDYNSIRVFSPNNKIISMACIEPATTPATNIRTSRYYISGTSMTLKSYTYTQIPNKNYPTVTANNYLYVTKVVGYK